MTEINDSMSFEEMLNASEEKRVHAGSIVKGVVTSISANEIQVDIGAKQTGFVRLSEACIAQGHGRDRQGC